MLFNDKKLTMYTSSKKGLTSNSYHVYPCISFQLKIQGTYTENIVLLEKKLTGSVAIMLMLYLSMDQIVTCPNIAT